LSPDANKENGLYEPNWWNFRFHGKQPDRRAYHSTFTHNGSLYVFGGKDISVGHLDNLWAIDLSEVGKLEHGKCETSENPEWRMIATTGV